MTSENGILLCDDLLFSSRVVGEAKAQGLALRWVKSVREMRDLARQTPPRCVIMDLHTPGLTIAEVVRELSALAPRPRIIGYGSHVDVATLKSAREAGCDVVWPRSKFAEELSVALPLWFSLEESS
jgi:DNA-binding NarL/FixJ family response regulator